MTRLLPSTLVFLFLICLCLQDCITIQNSFNNRDIRARSALDANYLRTHLPYGHLDWNTLDLQVFCMEDSTLADLHLTPSPDTNEIALTGYVRTLAHPQDSVHIQLLVPLTKNGFLLDSLSRSMPVFVTGIDSNETTNKLRTYAAECRDLQGRHYSIAAITDPIPLIVILLLGGYYVYKYFACKSEVQATINVCASRLRHPYWTYSLFNGCTFDSCGTK